MNCAKSKGIRMQIALRKYEEMQSGRCQCLGMRAVGSEACPSTDITETSPRTDITEACPSSEPAACTRGLWAPSVIASGLDSGVRAFASGLCSVCISLSVVGCVAKLAMRPQQQNKALRTAAGGPCFTRTADLHRDPGIEMLAERLRKLNKKSCKGLDQKENLLIKYLADISSNPFDHY
ncbi:hypothetical protein NDU88_000634 [Pleurodeles waltl]|uniref:Uncharacterized protein n=1 Tax=Pleurodeles waltl TaxID=8319 RepID=A0AAV7U416_PLEWA|nr:hypothetical protein NDU88_000634 [Pleurodeles waltl]